MVTRLTGARAPEWRECAVGDVVEGRYLLMKRAGMGAAGTVWAAWDLTRGIDVAVKMLRASHLESRKILAHFAREAELASRMLSPHIVRVLARGMTEADGPYVVYEHLEGEDLGKLLERRRRLAIVETRDIIVQVARALARAHALGVLHRDVKPANLFLATGADGRGVVKTLDFGLAEVMGSAQDGERSVVGTLEYIAPEVLFEESAPDARSDLYALAVVAYECLTGRVPYPAESLGELVVSIAAGAPPAPSALRAGLPPELDAWFETALARDPAARFASAKEMADAFDDAIDTLDRVPHASSRVRVDTPAAAREPLRSMVVARSDDPEAAADAAEPASRRA
jgi:serine/threonine-protein kinase